MEIKLNWLRSLVTVGRYVWCAAVTNIFMVGLIYTASLAGAQVNAMKELRDFKADIAEGVEQMQASKDIEDDLRGKRRLK